MEATSLQITCLQVVLELKNKAGAVCSGFLHSTCHGDYFAISTSFTNSHLPRPQRFLHVGRFSPALNCAGVLQTLHQ